MPDEYKTDTHGDMQSVAEQVVKKRRSRPDNAPKTEPGDNAKYIKHAMAMWDWPRLTFTDNEEVKKRTAMYFNLCEQNDMKPSVEGLALAYGINRVMLWRYANNGPDSAFIPPEVRNTLKKAYTIINGMMADYMQNGKINPVAGIFLMKNNMGYTDQTEVVITPNTPLGDNPSAPALADKYMNVIETSAEEQK